MASIYWLLNQIVGIVTLIVLAWVVIGWLFAFNIIRPGTSPAQDIYDFINRLLEPALRPIRKVLPRLGGMDFSPLVLVLGLQFVVMLFGELFVGFGPAR